MVKVVEIVKIVKVVPIAAESRSHRKDSLPSVFLIPQSEIQNPQCLLFLVLSS